VSLTDPQAAWVARKTADPYFAYDANYLIDNKAGIIVDAEGTRANRIVEIAITRTMLDRVGRRFQLRPQRLAADTAYGAVRLLKWLVDRNITPHIPVWDKSARSDGTLGRADFVFDRERNACPGGKLLHTTGTVIDGHTLRYRAAKRDCDVCALIGDFAALCAPIEEPQSADPDPVLERHPHRRLRGGIGWLARQGRWRVVAQTWPKTALTIEHPFVEFFFFRAPS
jgi:hypothetical protein